MADNPLSTFLPDRAATGFFPQMRPRRRFQDREGSANVPLDVMRGRLATMLGTPTDLANIFRSPMPTEMFGETNYEPAQQLPYGSEYFLKNLPLAPTSRVGEVAGQAGSFVPLNPMPAARAAAAGARMVGQGAMAAGQAGERFAERAVPQIMERGGLGAEMLQGMSRGTVSPLDVYHGSPYKFDRFDASKIGTGEGAQAYGHGLYLAENPGVAGAYKKNLSQGRAPLEVNLDGAPFPAPKVNYSNPDPQQQQLARIRTLLLQEGGDVDRAIARTYGADAAALESFRGRVSVGDPGFLYKVDLPNDQIAKMLDFDKPLKDQTPEIQALAKQYGLTDADHLGGDLVAAMNAKRATGANTMRQAGIPGIKYLDATSRGTGKGTRNFVVFPSEEKSLTILERNGQPGQNSLNSFIQRQGLMPSVVPNFPTSITNRSEIKNLANDFADQFKQMGFDVTVDHSGSKAGASSYLRVYDPQTGRFLKPIRISDHSKGPKELDANINVLNPQEDFAKITSALNDMRAKGDTLVFKQDRYAQELIASGVKPKTAYQRARAEITENQPVQQAMQDQQQNSLNSFIK